MTAISEKSALDGINLKEAAYKIVHDFRDYRNLGGLRRVIENAENQLSASGPLIRENQKSLTTLTNLRRAGYSKKDIKELVALVSMWSQGNGIGYRKLDTELLKIDVGTNGGGNLQHPNNGPSSSNPALLDRKLSPVEGNNDYGGGNFTMGDYLKLQMLKCSTTNMLSRMGIKN